mgnify:CR=1 FL=1
MMLFHDYYLTTAIQLILYVGVAKKLFHSKLPDIGAAIVKSDCIFSVTKKC